jgi:ABC-type branched-subunit amino acid transport system ATPase component/ABC-type branched-subunit amino acid transport system permease subunit
MTEFTRFFLLGLGAGGIYALIALGIVLVYRGSGIVNFSAGGLALFGAAVFYELRDLNSMATLPALLFAVAASAGVGALIQLVIMRPMRRSSPLARVIATLGIMAAFQTWALIRYGSAIPFVSQFLPNKTLEPLSGVTIGADRLWILGITVALTVVLALTYRYTRFGLATTGIAENELATATLGWSPGIVATVNWAAGGALSGLAGILLLPIVGVNAGALTFVIVPALAAALVGNFSSFPLTLAGGLLVGVLEAEVTSQGDWVPGFMKAPGWSTAAPLIVILVILVVRGRALPLRSHLADRLPKIGSATIRWPVVIFSMVLVLLSLAIFTPSWSDAVLSTAIFAVLSLSLIVVTGYAGQLSLAQFALAGVGAWASSRAADVWGVPFIVALLIGIAATVPIGLLVALPAVRARGVNLAVATLALSVVITSILLNNPDYTGGTIKGTQVGTPDLFGWKIDSLNHSDRYAGVAIVLTALCALLVVNLRRSSTGRTLIAVRDNERAAASLGVSVVGAKLYAFSVGAAIASIAGVLLAFQFNNVDFSKYSVLGSVQSLLYAVIGGIGFVSGSVIAGLNAVGGTGQYVLNQLLSGVDFFSDPVKFALLGALLLLVVIVIHPDGIAELNARNNDKLRAQLRRVRKTRPAPEQDDKSVSVVRQRVTPRHLELRNVTVRFGSVVALDQVSLGVGPGEVVGLIGPNGAGKTTLIDAATGFLSCSGEVLLDGELLNRRSPRGRALRGLTRSFQSLELFEDMTVSDNLRVASDPRSRWSYLVDLLRPGRPSLSSVARATVQEFKLSHALDKLPAELPYAQRRLVAIARAVATSPSVLLLDEPAAGLDDASTRELSALIRTLAADWGMGVLLIEHDVSMVMSTCDRVVALDFGSVIASGTPAEIRENDAVVDAYLGTLHVDEGSSGNVAASNSQESA